MVVKETATECVISGCNQGRSQNLKEVPQNFRDVFDIDDLTANDIYRETNIAKKKNLQFHSNH